LTSVQPVPLGANWIWPKPLAADAVMNPVTPVVRSWTSVLRPCEVSFMVTTILSPGCMNITSG